MKLFLFNPDNDLALANADPHFIAPASARKMASDLDVLPLWWAEEGDAVWVESAARAGRVAREWAAVLPRVAFWTGAEAPPAADFRPWGFSPMLLERLRRMGAPQDWRLTEEQMHAVRRLSSRALAVRLLAHLRARFPGELLCGESHLCTTADEAARRIVHHPRTLLKMPWSGSGKGLRLGFGRWEPPLSGWVGNVLRTQGAVVVEPFYPKVADLAMEFESDGCGAVRYTGLSLFATHAQGAYAGNVVAAEGLKERALHRLLPEALCTAVRAAVTEWLAEQVGPHYRGPLGVDMMVCAAAEGGEGLRLHPCVEVNLRRTMGEVAVHLGRKLAPGSVGMFRVDYFGRPAELAADHARRTALTPPCIEAGRLRSGCFSLTPVECTTSYRASLQVGGSVEWGGMQIPFI